MKSLSIDIETYSSVDIKKSGLYKYVESEDFEILLFAYAYNDEKVNIIDMAQGEKIPEYIINDLNNPNVIKTAYNASFEYNALNKFYKTDLRQWRCSMIHAMYCGYPIGLEAVNKAMGFSEDKKKMSIGRALIKYFCSPVKPTNTNGNRTRNLPKHDLDKWDLFKKYCKQDVVAEMEIKNRLINYPYPDDELKLWLIDQRINKRGIQIDKRLIEGALYIIDKINDSHINELIDITKLENPNSVAQLTKWLEKELNIEIDSLNKEKVDELLKTLDKNKYPHVIRALELRKELAKSSIKKYEAMEDVMCSDGRVRGLLQFYGANRTGRWAGRLVQVQNLPRNYIETLDLARELVKEKKIDNLKIIYGNVPDTISQLIRTAFIPEKEHKFIVADFSAIEARVIAWLSKEEWRLKVFKTHGKIYEASASEMFNVPIEKIKKGNPEYSLRAKGKIAELALGYQGGTGALIQMGALNMGLKEEDLNDIVKRWRNSNKNICNFWNEVEKKAKETIEYGITLTMDNGIEFSRDNKNFIITLPSGRQLFYIEPVIVTANNGRKSIYFKGMNQTTKKWELMTTYGGKLVENIVQAVARDCLANAIINLETNGYEIVMHIHDECVIEAKEDKTLENAIKIMCKLPRWAKDLPLNADGFEGNYYKKE